MTNIKSTKKALLSSVVALLVCFSMLLGTTFAWFTDSAISANNKIVAGNLDVKLFQWTDENTRVDISENKDPVFTADILWEPGMTQVVYLSIENAGSLALKYQVALNVTGVSTHSLTDVMEYDILPDVKFGDATPWDETANNGTKVTPGMNDTEADDVPLYSGDEHFFALSVHMLTSATNEYMGETITFDIKVLAGQLAYEEDSFGSDYDILAAYNGEGYADVMTGTTTAADIVVKGDDGYQVGSVLVPRAAQDDNATKLIAKITESNYNANITIGAGMEVTKYDVTVEGIKADNTEPIKVQLKIAKNLDPSTVSVYHYNTKVEDATYNPNTGYVSFETASFSPFTIVYDADSVYIPPVAGDDDLPAASVNAAPEYVGVSLPWGSYGQWSPNSNIDADPKLEAAYVFACTETFDEALLNPYANWECDFFVKLDRDLGANQLFLGGNYGSFGWVGFHNGDVTLAANEEVALLGSVTSNPWTYLDVVQNVGTFICGVGDVDDALAGATFTVTLRLTNSETGETIDIATIPYTFN